MFSASFFGSPLPGGCCGGKQEIKMKISMLEPEAEQPWFRLFGNVVAPIASEQLHNRGGAGLPKLVPMKPGRAGIERKPKIEEH